ncbi:MAG: hypothetical protein KDC44_18060, partial [Phaeodactylibacter sp.]|nr:hypothetical protein [Phaeodactylibacter sp.]
MKRLLLTVCLPIFLLTIFSSTSLLGQEDCECTNCPVPIQDNGTFQGFLDVVVDGPNDLSLCPLQQVCFTITHTWVGDLSCTLTSPGGLNYLVMADANNNTGGCGTNADNIDVCITTGMGNPLTNNQEYMCNGGNPCLQGNWTVPCGGVTDPISGAVQAPNCDLNDFNLPGQPANGTWTLTVNDICAQDIGFLQTWELVFACGTQSCITCEANGGNLNQPDVQGCQGDPALNLNVVPNYAGPAGPAPDPADYSYTFVLSQNGIIQQWMQAPGPNLSFQPPGTYEICGLSYATVDEGAYLVFTGQPLANLQNALDNGTAGFCGDLSNDCFTAVIGPPIPPTILDTMICLGDCFTAPNGMVCCSPGPCQYVLPSYLGCDSMIIMNISLLFPDQTQVSETLCLDECVTVAGVEYCPPGVYVIPFTNQQGCDSIVTLQLLPVPVVAVTAPGPTITCDQPAVLLDGSGSLGSGWTWTNPGGMVIGTTPTVVVNEPGCYLLTVENTINGVTCTDTSTVCVQEDLEIPAMPNIFGPTTVCGNAIELYSIAIDPIATDYIWTIPPGATIVSGGNGTNTIEINWSGSAGGQVCVSGANACGFGPQACIFVTIDAVPTTPVVSGPTVVCPFDIEVYMVTNDPNVTNYSWTVPAGAIIMNGQGSNSITVNWGSSSGGDVCVVASNNCGNSMPACLPVVAGTLPAVPVVSGPATVCIGDVVNYTTPADPLATNYAWTVPSCATILSGQGTNSISVEWANPPCSGGNICVTASNNCGITNPGCLPVSVDPAPIQPQLSGPNTACAGDIDFFSVNPVPGATTYTWTVTGGTIVFGQGSDMLEVIWTAPGGGTVCVNATTPCGTGPDACINTLVNSVAATPVIAGPAIVCDGSVVQYSVPADPAATGYVWSTNCGQITAGQNTNAITVDWTGCPSGGDVCVIVESLCGPTSQVCIPVQGGTEPSDPVISGPMQSCVGANETYCANPDPNTASYNWTVIGGTITGGQGTDCVDVDWTTTVSTQVCVQAENGCGVSGQVCFDVTVDGVPEAPTITGQDTVCVGDVVIYTVSSADPTTIDFTWSTQGGCGSILSTPATDQVEVSWDVAGTCQVCATANNDCGPGTLACYEVTIIAIPAPDAGADEDICGLTYDLNGSVPVGTGTWTASGPGNATFSDPNAATATVTVDAYGSYTFTWTDNDNDCVGSDDVVISFNPDPVIDGAITELCDATGFFYTVTFTLTGGQPPYTVTGTVMGTMNGDTFTSNDIASGMPYSFQVFDNLGCGPLLIEGQETCDCVSDPGTMDLTLLEACEDQTVTAIAPTDANFDPDDTFEFILHTDNGTNGSTLGMILDQNT